MVLAKSSQLFGAAVLAVSALVAHAATAPAAVVSACERAVRNTLLTDRGVAASTGASFDAAPTSLPGAADAVETAWRGSGQWRNANQVRTFRYSCTFDTATREVAGVVVRDGGDAAAALPARAVEPDLSQLSPAACESAAARALKQRWPGVAQIAFDGATRRLAQTAGGPAELQGQGRALPSVRDASKHFSYDCSVDPRNGRVLALRLNE